MTRDPCRWLVPATTLLAGRLAAQVGSPPNDSRDFVSNFPRFDRNLNTGGTNWNETTWINATNTIHHSAKHPSHILLPIVSAAERSR
jgi:hypothetical protein